MQAAMDRLERLIARRRRLVLIAWFVIVLVSVPFASRQTENLTGGGFETEGSGSKVVADALARDFPGMQPSDLAIVFDNRGGDAAALAAAFEKVEREGFHDVEGARLNPEALAAAKASNEDVIVMPLVVSGNRDEAVDAASVMRENLEVGTGPVPLHVVGPSALWAGLQELSKEDLEKAEIVGLPIVLIVLLAVFGSLAAAALPLALGVASVLVTGAIVFWLSKVYGMSIFVTNMASMLGIGVAVDYSLFILARYREELDEGRSPDDARAVALRTSGLAVTFSGVTVIVALAGLFLIDATVVRSMAVGAIVVVAIAVLAAVTLLPALIAALGRRASEPGKIVGRVFRRRRAPKPGPSFWERWTSTLMKRPVPFALGATALMLLIAAPALSLKTDTAAVAMFPEGFETREGFELASEALGRGEMGPVQIVADFGRDQADSGALTAYAETVRGLPGVKEVDAPVASADGRKALLVVIPTDGPESASTKALVDRLRDTAGPQGASVSIGGATAQNSDDTAVISGSLWKVGLFVLVLSFVVLLCVLRSVLLPLKAVLMNALSVAAAYGVLVIVFQWGWFDGFLGFQSLGYVQAITPALLLAVVFGLSMDYEVFMLSRIKERYQATGDNRLAVAQGLQASARTISSAAVIMVAVFAIFAGTGVPQVKEIGVGLAVAIALDATVVRLVLVPTTMELMGHWNWWLPKWLDRVLPDMDFEASEPPPKVQTPATVETV